ncbi:MAG: efflux RND transporter permease subunit [Gemmatimonadales bacterium]
MFVDTFIRRPVLSTVCSLVIILAGAIAIPTLPIAQYPELAPPQVSVTSVYTGASAQTVETAVTIPIEQAINGVEGLLYMTSTSTNSGLSTVTATFELSRNQDLAAVDVQNQVKLAEPQLPQEVRQNGVTVKKAQKDILLMVALASDDPRYDAEYLSNFLKINVEDELKKLNGVGDATVYGQLEFSMLIALDPYRMAQLGVSVPEIVSAVREQNATNPGGRIGREPAPPGTQLTLSVTTKGRLTDPKEYENIVIRAHKDGSLLRIGDIGAVRLGARNYDLLGRLNGKATAIIPVYLRSGANALDVKEEIVKRLDELGKTFPPGVTARVVYDTTPFVEASIEEVVHTLVEAMVLVFIVVFVFLQSWRATLIPALAVPVSIIGTFFGMQMFGFSVNSITLFGLVLAIGIVVDDAIVVVENVERIMAERHVSPAQASDEAMAEVSGALIAIVLVLCAVFVPVAFMGGLTGRLYKQFALTIAVSVIISGIVALTLTPALCAVLLKPHQPGHKKWAPFEWFNRAFDTVTGGYGRIVNAGLGASKTMLASFVVMLVLAGWLFQRTPTAFLPSEDKGYFVAFVALPDAASLQRTDAVVQRVEQALMADPAVENVTVLEGLDFISNANQTNTATIFVTLKPWHDREADSLQLTAVVARANASIAAISEAQGFAFNMPEIPGLGVTAGLEMYIQNRGVGDYAQFVAVGQEFLQELNKTGAVKARTGIRPNVPAYHLDVDREKAKTLGLDMGDIFQTLQAMLSTYYINDFNLYGKTYRVQAEAKPQFRTGPDDIGKLYVRNDKGAMVPVSAFTRGGMKGGPALVTRFNGFTAAQVNGEPGPGKSSGEMLATADRMGQEFAARGLGYAYGGQSLQEKLAGGSTAMIFGLGIVMVFLILSAQYESWSLPVAVLLVVPFGLLGALLAIMVRGIPNDLYFTIGLVTVVGLAAKNAILIVEFANVLHVKGMPFREAAVRAAKERFRPILMTSFAFILGVVPLVIASGAGAGSRNSLGTGVFGGMLAATVIGVFFTPLFYLVVSSVSSRFGKAKVPVVETAPAGVAVAPAHSPDAEH